MKKEVKEYVEKYFDVVKDEHIKWNKISEGKSESEVYLIAVLKSQYNKSVEGRYIIKSSLLNKKWKNEKQNEAINCKKVIEQAGEFSSFLCDQIHYYIMGDTLLQIMKIALNQYVNPVTLSSIKKEEQYKFIEKISYELLKIWNKDFKSVAKTEANCIQRWLDYRLSIGDNKKSRIQTATESILEVSNKPSFHFLGNFYPNAGYYISKIDKLIQEKDYSFIVGKNHGDLHGLNIFTSKQGSQMDYCIIDFDTYNTDIPLLFDHAYLEFSLLCTHYEDCSLEDWINKCEKAITIEPLGIITEIDYCAEYFYRVRNAIIGAIFKWGSEERPQAIQDLSIQFLIAEIAVGINYLCKNNIDRKIQLLALLYSSILLKKLFEVLNFDWNKEDGGKLLVHTNNNVTTTDIWEKCHKFSNTYTKILIIDSSRTDLDYTRLLPITKIKWTLIIDIAKSDTISILYKEMFNKFKEELNICICDDTTKEIPEGTNICYWLNTNKNELIYRYFNKYKNIFNEIIKNIKLSRPLKPVLMIVDSDDKSIIEKYIELILESEGLFNQESVINYLNGDLKNDLYQYLKELNVETNYIMNEDIISISEMLYEYGVGKTKVPINHTLPGIRGDIIIKKEELLFWNESVEVLYTGIENEGENDFGQGFYKGNEIGWGDLSQQLDIICDYEKNYSIVFNNLRSMMQKYKTQIKYLYHGAGMGGTTYARRLAWDLREEYPTVIINKYNSDTGKIICEIYRKTGKNVLVIAEVGESIISEHQAYQLSEYVNRENCRVFILCVMRNLYKKQEDIIEDEIQEDESSVLLSIPSELPPKVAHKFHSKYSILSNSKDRKKAIYNITYNAYESEWEGQKCPFFYGFYAYQDEYQGLNNYIHKLINDSSPEIKTVLRDISILTVYSQNLCISHQEMLIRLKLNNEQFTLIGRNLGEAVTKILVEKDKGYRICHILIARKILEQLLPDTEHNQRLFTLLKEFINTESEIYSDNREYVDILFKELLVGRNSSLDIEKTYFSPLITDIGNVILQKEIFELLIELYPENPHYYNHLGRLFIAKEPFNFDKALSNLNTAIEIAKNNQEDLSTHYTTLGCIYSRRIKHYLNGVRKNHEEKKKITVILNEISKDFEYATDAFSDAREKNPRSTYSYVPNINMITFIIKKIVIYSDKSLDNLLKSNVEFYRWYIKNIQVAFNLINLMDQECIKDELNLYKNNCISRIEEAKCNIDFLRNKLKSTLSASEKVTLHRSIASIIMMSKKYDIRKLKINEKEEIADMMYDNIVSGLANQQDLITWFNIYRYLDSFDVYEAINIIQDYMEDNYRKSYYLYLLNYLLFEKGLIDIATLKAHMNQCKKLAQATYGLKTSRNLDAYFEIDNGCKIRSFNNLYEGESDKLQLEKLHTFSGKIFNVSGSTSASIILANSSLKAYFPPSLTASNLENEADTMFTKSDEGADVTFNLMFSYDGLRAWNVRRVKTHTNSK